MSMARTARRRRRQMSNNNHQWSGLRVPRYGRVKDAAAVANRLARKRARWAKTGSNMGGQAK